jgi:capsular polysaccharide biosynthesis protein
LTNGVTRLFNEQIIENVFYKAGFEPIYPELLSLSDQINLFRFADKIVGTTGSSFHTIAFVESPIAKRIVFNFTKHVNSNYSLLDHGFESPGSYFSLADRLSQTKSEAFMNEWQAESIEDLAEEMLEKVMCV